MLVYINLLFELFKEYKSRLFKKLSLNFFDYFFFCSGSSEWERFTNSIYSIYSFIWMLILVTAINLALISHLVAEQNPMT